MIYTTCGSCGITVPWQSRHKCCTNAGPLSIPGPGFNVRPVYSEIDMVTRRDAVDLSRRTEPVGVQAREIVKWDRRNDKIKRQRRAGIEPHNPIRVGPFEAGMRAFERGESWGSCPAYTDAHDRLSWHRGWTVAMHEERWRRVRVGSGGQDDDSI